MINVQNFIQILYLVLSNGRLIRRNIQYIHSKTQNQLDVLLKQMARDSEYSDWDAVVFVPKH